MAKNVDYKNWGSQKHPDKIYKYRKWNKAEHRKILTENEIYFAKPLQITADYELALKTDYDNVTEQEKYNYFYNYSLGMPFGSIDERIAFVKEQAGRVDFSDKTFLDSIEQWYKNEINNIVGYFCASENKTSDWLWSSFAGHTNGFCVGFHTKLMFPEDDIYTGGSRVEYYTKENEPLIKPFYGDDSRQRINDHLKLLNYLPKDLFVNEEEYRVVRAISITGQKATIPAEAYAEIIVGSSMKQSCIKTIQGIVKTNFPKAVLLQAVMTNGNYTFIDIE